MFDESPQATRRSELLATLRLAGPMVSTNLLWMAIYATDVMFVARLGQESLAASSLGVSLSGLINWAMSGLVGAAAPLIAAELGRARHAVREVRRSFRMGLWLAVACSAVSMALCVNGEAIMRLTGQTPVLSRMTGGFLAILVFSMPPLIVSSHLRNTVSALGRPFYATLIAALAVGVNALGNYTLVFGHFGAPALGLRGSALSSVVTGVAMVSGYVLALSADRHLRRYRLWGRWWRPEWSRMREMLKIGLPIAATIVAEAGLFSGAAFLMGLIGETSLAAHTLALGIAALAFQVPFGLGQAATIRVGYHYGARDPHAIALAGWTAIVLGVGVMALTAAAMLFAPHALLGLYVDTDAPENAALVQLASKFLLIGAAFQLFDGLQAVAAGTLRGLQDTRVPMWQALFGYWVPGMGTAVWLGFFTPLQGVGIWIGFAVGLMTVALLLLRRWTLRARLGLLPD
jgi:MATE family multidrug resistance protein